MVTNGIGDSQSNGNELSMAVVNEEKGLPIYNDNSNSGCIEAVKTSY